MQGSITPDAGNPSSAKRRLNSWAFPRRPHEHRMGDPSTGMGAPGPSRCRSALLCRHQAYTSPQRRSADTLNPPSTRECVADLRTFLLTAPELTCLALVPAERTIYL